MDLFSQIETDPKNQPLAERLRPRTLAEFVGQKKIADPSAPLLKNLSERGFLPNLILWGPPGTGKTTFANLISRQIKAHLVVCNAIDTGAKDLKTLGAAAKDRRIQFGERTVIFIDEIHRLNRAQQDVLLPFTEKGDVILIGATTENPSYELNSALLSRARVLVFEALTEEDLAHLLNRAAELVGVPLTSVLSQEAQALLLQNAAGDARRVLNTFENIANIYVASASDAKWPLTIDGLNELQVLGPVRYDKNRDEHYDVISAFIKSVRGSDPDAAIYYLARMLEGGEDPVFVARRLVILASEDIGNADPRALQVAISGLQAVELVGMPEARISLAQVTTYLACAPKSNRSYVAINDALAIVRETGALPVPLHLRSAQTQLAKNLGHGVNYHYPHEHSRGFVEQGYLPEKLATKKFYEPSSLGFEKTLKSYLDWIRTGKNTTGGGDQSQS